MVITSVALTTSMGRPRWLWRLSSCAHGGFDADQQNADAQLARGENRAFDFGARRMVASHGVHGDGGHL